jgi:transposase
MGSDKSGAVWGKGEAQGRARCRVINRDQLFFRSVDVEKLVEADHPVRAIWELVGQLDLEPFYAQIEAVEGVAGRPGWDPQLLISLWVYAYKEGVSSAREVSRLCEYHPGYQWLTAMEGVNYHTLADFRIQHKEVLDRIFIGVLGVLSHQGLITLERVMQDGSKVKANAGDKSFRRKATLERHLELARKQVEQMGDPLSEELPKRVARARQRALREKQERLKLALQELEKIEASRGKRGEEKEVRASTTDPEARVMLQAKGAYGSAYNVQLSTDARAKIIVGVGVSQSASDAGELEPGVERVEANLGEKPKQMVVDEGYTNSGSLEAMAEREIDLIGSVPEPRKAPWDPWQHRGVGREFYPERFGYDSGADRYICPAGQGLSYETREQHGGWWHYRYRARGSDCQSCAFQGQCCPGTKKGRSLIRREQTAEWKAFRAKMETAEAKEIYKQRSEVAEFPNAWIKDKIGLRQFRLRGLAKVTLEAMWACLTYNISQWIRLCWKPQRLAQALG